MSDKDKSKSNPNQQMLTIPFGADEDPQHVNAQHHCNGCNTKGQQWGAGLVAALTQYQDQEHLELVGQVCNAVNNAIKAAAAPFVPALIAAARDQGNSKLPFGVILLATHDAQVQLINQLCGEHHPLGRAAAMSGIHRALLMQSIAGTSVYHAERIRALGLAPQVDIEDGQDSVLELLESPISVEMLRDILGAEEYLNDASNGGVYEATDRGAVLREGLTAITAMMPEADNELTADRMQAILDATRAVAVKVSRDGQISETMAANLAQGQAIVDAKRASEVALSKLEAGKSDPDIQGVISMLESVLQLAPGTTPHIALGKINGDPKTPAKHKAVHVLEFDKMPSEEELADIIYGQIKEEHPSATITRANIVNAIRSGVVIKQ